jgi:hypothetical protein
VNTELTISRLARRSVTWASGNQNDAHLDLEAAHILDLYRTQIRYLLSELDRIGWTPYPAEPHAQ